MKLEKFYKKAIEIGIKNDFRSKEEIQKQLDEEKSKFDKLSDEEKEFFDKDKLFNPYADTRILNGDPQTEVHRIIVGIDMEIGEILLTYLLNQRGENKIDLIISHHPEGTALAQLYQVMKLQSDILARFGVTLSVAEQLMEKRISEVERRLLSLNHIRHTEVARLLGIPMMCIHTPADNCVTSYLNKLFEKEKPYRLKDLLEIIKNIPEYRNFQKYQIFPKLVNGSENNKCGKIYVDMTGGTEGSKDIFDQLATSGISTLVAMHYSEEHIRQAKKANVNVIIAGHIPSDVLGLNLLFDEIEKEEPFEFVEISGFKRIRH